MEEVKQTSEMSKCEMLLLSMEELGDVTFSVGPPDQTENIKGFVCILRTFSPVFKEMFNDHWKSQNKVVELPDIEPKVFRLFLKFLLTDSLKIAHLNDSNLSMEETLHLLYISNKYDIETIQHVCRISIMDNLDTENVVMAFETLQFLDEPILGDFCFQYIKKNIANVLEEESFVNLSRGSLIKVLKSYLDSEEISIFKGVYRWAEFQSGFITAKSHDKTRPQNVDSSKAGGIREFLDKILYKIRFPLISTKDFFTFVQPTGVLTAEETVQVFHCVTFKDDPDFVNNTPFITKSRDWSLEKSLSKLFATFLKDEIEMCAIITPRRQILLKRVTFQSLRKSKYEYNVKFRISSSCFRDIVPTFTISFTTPGEPFHHDLETPVPLLPDGCYMAFYDGKRDKIPRSYFKANISGDSLVVSVI